MKDHSKLIEQFKNVPRPTNKEFTDTIKVLKWTLEVLREEDKLKDKFTRFVDGKNKLIDPILALIDAYEAGI